MPSSVEKKLPSLILCSLEDDGIYGSDYTPPGKEQIPDFFDFFCFFVHLICRIPLLIMLRTFALA